MARRTTLTRLQLAKAMGCNGRTIAKWLEEGMPVEERGRGGRASRYDERKVRAWVAAREKAGGMSEVARERARKERAQAVLAEQLAASRSQDLLPRVDVERVWAAEVAAVRAKLLSWPATLADRLTRVASLEGEVGVERVLDEAVRDALRELAGGGDQVAPAGKRRKGRAA